MNDGKGEQVFSGNVNEMLADKIVRHTREHSYVEEDGRESTRRSAAGLSGLLVAVAALAVVALAGVVLLWDDGKRRG